MKTIFWVILQLAADIANACSCAGRMTPADQFKEAEIVFVGRVESVHDRYGFLTRLFGHVDEKHYCKDVGMEVTFGVLKAWKGVSTRHVVLLTGRGGGDCGVEFKTGVDYIVYAWPPGESGCQTNACTRTRELLYGAEDLEFLQQKTVLKVR